MPKGKLHAILLLAAAAPGWAQFTDLATTDDGQDLYFSSQLRIEPASPAIPESRVFQVGPSGIGLFADAGVIALNDGSSGSTNGVGQAQPTGDGSVIGVTAQNICPAAGPCPTPVLAEGLLRGSKNADLGPGALQLSRNGQWAVLTQTVIPVPPATGPPTTTATLIDLQANQTRAIPTPVANYGVVASSGAVLVTQNGAPGIWKQGQFTPVQLLSPIGSSGAVAFRLNALSDDGGTLILSTISLTPGAGPSLIAQNIVSGNKTTLYASANSTEQVNFLGMTNDGSRVLYNVWRGQTAGPAFVGYTVDGASILLPLDSGELATAGTLSGSGNVAYLATTNGRIVKFSLSAGGASPGETVVPESFYVSPSVFAPGSIAHFQGVLPRSADQLAGHVILDGNIVPVLYAGADDIRVQIPWEQKTGRASLLLNMTTGSPFYQNDLVSVLPYTPKIERADAGQQGLLGLKLVKGDFSGLVTGQPQPGDLIVAYFTGLGPVSGSVQTGMPAPTDSLRPIIGQLTCQFQPGQSPMKTMYAGLAPLMIGLYQVTFQMPADAGKAPISGLQCTVSGPGGGGSFTTFGVLTGS